MPDNSNAQKVNKSSLQKPKKRHLLECFLKIYLFMKKRGIVFQGAYLLNESDNGL